MRLALITVGMMAFTAAMAGDAAAQYYYAPPGYYRRPAPIGYQCRGVLPTPYGPRPIICPLADPKPVGRACGCPAPGYGNTFVRGRTIR